jgi:uncharacterized protein with PIN domain
MNQATFRFYAELNDFLSRERQFVAFPHAFRGHPAIKDTIEALGIPHTEVDLILANGESVDFAYHLQHGDYVSVYPVFEALDITPILRVRPAPLRVTRFVCDVHLGTLARYLRMLGFDTLYPDERRILLTRDQGLVKRGVVTHGYCVRDTHPERQLLEVVRRFDLFRALEPFKRCMKCNGLLEPVPKEEILERLPPGTRHHYDVFHMCLDCQQIYWPGSHHQRMQRLIAHLRRQGPSADV